MNARNSAGCPLYAPPGQHHLFYGPGHQCLNTGTYWQDTLNVTGWVIHVTLVVVLLMCLVALAAGARPRGRFLTAAGLCVFGLAALDPRIAVPVAAAVAVLAAAVMAVVLAVRRSARRSVHRYTIPAEIEESPR